MIHNSYTARIAIPLLYQAPLSEEITWGKLHELGNCINEFFRQNALFFSSWGLNTVTNSFTNIKQLDPRWPVIVSTQKYLFVAKKFSWHWEQLILPMNLKNLLVGGNNVIFFFLLGKQITIWKRKMKDVKPSGSEKAMAPHSSTLAWKIPWTEEPGGLQSMGSLRIGLDWATSLSLFTFMHWRRKWQPTPVFLPGESQERQSLVGCHLWGRTESDTTEAT